MRALRTSISVVLCAASAACHTWEPNPLPSPQNGLRPGDYVRVHQTSGALLDFTVVDLVSDSLIGRSGRDRVAVALTDVRRIDTARFSGDRTAAMVVASVLAIPAGFILLLLLSGESLAPTF